MKDAQELLEITTGKGRGKGGEKGKGQKPPGGRACALNAKCSASTDWLLGGTGMLEHARALGFFFSFTRRRNARRGRFYAAPARPYPLRQACHWGCR